MADITTLPPPCMTKQRALEIYTEPFRRIVEYTNLCHVKGDICEFGTYNGFTARLFAELMQQYKDNRVLYLYDSWEGFPEPKGNDKACKEVIEGYWKKGDCAPPLGGDTPMRIKQILGFFIPGKIKTVQGFYEHTLQKLENLPEQISILHIDCDLYESTKIVLEKTQYRLSPGAVILFDDFNNNLANNNFGERKAFKETIDKYCEPWFTYGWSGYAFIYNPLTM